MRRLAFEIALEEPPGYRFALAAWRLSELTWRVTSSRMSKTRARFCLELSSLASARRRRLLYLVRPAASSRRDGAAVLRLRRKNLPDAPLLDDGVAFRTEAAAHEDVLDVAQARLAAINEVFAFAGAEEAAGDGDFAGLRAGVVDGVDLVGLGGFDVHDFGSGIGGGRGVRRESGRLGGGEQGRFLGEGVDEHHGDRGHTDGFARFGAGEDDVFHAGAAQAAGGLLAEDPADGIAEIGFTTAIGADDGGDAVPGEAQFGAVAERLKTLEFDFPQLEHVLTSVVRRSGESRTILPSIAAKVKGKVYRMQWVRADDHNLLWFGCSDRGVAGVLEKKLGFFRWPVFSERKGRAGRRRWRWADGGVRGGESEVRRTEALSSTTHIRHPGWRISGRGVGKLLRGLQIKIWPARHR